MCATVAPQHIRNGDGVLVQTQQKEQIIMSKLWKKRENFFNLIRAFLSVFPTELRVPVYLLYWMHWIPLQNILQLQSSRNDLLSSFGVRPLHFFFLFLFLDALHSAQQLQIDRSNKKKKLKSMKTLAKNFFRSFDGTPIKIAILQWKIQLHQLMDKLKIYHSTSQCAN